MRLREITSNPQLAQAQQQLINLGYDLGAKGADGFDGPYTQKAVRAYQTKNNLRVDGVIGPQTLGSLAQAKGKTQPTAPQTAPTKPPSQPKDLASPETKNTGITVCLFKGMHTREGVVGNSSLAAIARAVGGELFEGRDSAGALKYYQTRPNTRLVVVGYSLGTEGVMSMQSARPALSITIAGWPTTLEQLSTRVQGSWYNFYQQRELDGILASKYRRGPYKPQGGTSVPVEYNHAEIVGKVSSQVIGLIKQIK